jgi:hypothetical protein
MRMIIIMITDMGTMGTIITTTVMCTIMGMPTTTTMTTPMIAPLATPDCSIAAPIRRVKRSPA